MLRLHQKPKPLNCVSFYFLSLHSDKINSLTFDQKGKIFVSNELFIDILLVESFVFSKLISSVAFFRLFEDLVSISDP